MCEFYSNIFRFAGVGLISEFTVALYEFVTRNCNLN